MRLERIRVKNFNLEDHERSGVLDEEIQSMLDGNTAQTEKVFFIQLQIFQETVPVRLHTM